VPRRKKGGKGPAERFPSARAYIWMPDAVGVVEGCIRLDGWWSKNDTWAPLFMESSVSRGGWIIIYTEF
jgi:hypothetical protein